MSTYQPESNPVHPDIAGLVGHYILCGAKRTGFYIFREFLRRGIPCVVIDEDPAEIVSLKEKFSNPMDQFLYVDGDATEDEILEAAGVTQAKGLITVMNDDKDNLLVILTARSLNPDIRIITGVNSEINREKLEKVGADKVISTYAIGGLRAASEMIRPEVVDFLDQLVHTKKTKALHFTELAVADIRISALAAIIEAQRDDSHAPSLQVKDIGKYTGLLVIAIKTSNNYDNIEADNFDDDLFQVRRRYRFTPRGDVALNIDDILVVIGTQDQLDEVRNR